MRDPRQLVRDAERDLRRVQSAQLLGGAGDLAQGDRRGRIAAHADRGVADDQVVLAYLEHPRGELRCAQLHGMSGRVHRIACHDCRTRRPGSHPERLQFGISADHADRGRVGSQGVSGDLREHRLDSLPQ